MCVKCTRNITHVPEMCLVETCQVNCSSPFNVPDMFLPVSRCLRPSVTSSPTLVEIAVSTIPSDRPLNSPVCHSSSAEPILLIVAADPQPNDDKAFENENSASATILQRVSKRPHSHPKLPSLTSSDYTISTSYEPDRILHQT